MDRALGASTTNELVGRTLGGKYVVETALGGGSMGTVYRARQIALERTVAIKVMATELATTPDFVARFHREAKAASQLGHRSSIAVTDFGEEPDGLLYLVMEYVPGRNLDRVIQEEWPLTPARIASILEQILSAVAAAHDLGIVHRDLKPENVLVVPTIDDEGEAVDVVKVCDFGIATMMGEAEGARPAGTAGVGAGGARKLTAVGAILGTPAYMSPEQVQGLPPDTRSDLYALGGMLYEMLTKSIPFDLDAPDALLRAHLLQTPRHPRELVPSCDLGLADIAMRALEKEPDARFASARIMRSAIRRAASGRGDDDRPETMRTPLAPIAHSIARPEGASSSSSEPVRSRATLVSTTLPAPAPAVTSRTSASWLVAGALVAIALLGALSVGPLARRRADGSRGLVATSSPAVVPSPAAPHAPAAPAPSATASPEPAVGAASRAEAPSAPSPRLSALAAAKPRAEAPAASAGAGADAPPPPVPANAPGNAAAPAAPGNAAAPAASGNAAAPEPAPAAAPPAYSPDHARVVASITTVTGTPRSALTTLLAHVVFTPCYVTALRTLGRAEGGRGTMRLDIDEDGVVQSASVRLPPALASASSCFASRIQRQRLPSPPDTGTASAELALELAP